MATVSVTQSLYSDIMATVSVTQSLYSGILKVLKIRKGWTGYAQGLLSSILRTFSITTQTLKSNILELTPISVEQTSRFSLLDAPGLTTVKPLAMVLLDGSDVTDKVMDCRISYSREKYCGEVAIVWKDWTVFNLIDCSDIGLNYRKERLEVKTRLSANDAWTSQGLFFLEKRDTRAVPDEILPSSWGRNRPAILGEPYALPITRTWNADTTARGIAVEVMAGLATLDWQIMDFPVRAGKFSVDKERPIRIIDRLAGVVGGILTTDKDGKVRVIYKWEI